MKPNNFAAEAARLLGSAQAMSVKTEAAEKKILQAAIARDKVVRARLEELRPLVLVQPGASHEYQVLTLELRRLALVIEMARKHLKD